MRDREVKSRVGIRGIKLKLLRFFFWKRSTTIIYLPSHPLDWDNVSIETLRERRSAKKYPTKFGQVVFFNKIRF